MLSVGYKEGSLIAHGIQIQGYAYIILIGHNFTDR